MSPTSAEVTQLLQGVRDGDERAISRLMPLVYGELRRLAGRYMRDERGNHTLQPTALVHEAYLRLVDQKGVKWQGRAHFMGVAAQMMRRILVDHARGHARVKRGGAQIRVPLEEAIRRLTSLPAGNLKLRRRGHLRPGYYADIAVFDPAAIQDHATFADSHQYATGMAHVFVNGVQVLKDGEHTGATPGRVVHGASRSPDQ